MTRFLSISLCALALGTTALAGVVLAQPAPAPASAPAPRPYTVNGQVVSMDGVALTVKGADGKTVTVTITPQTRLILVTRIRPDEIKPGSFVATANNAETGVSSELRVFGPSMAGLGEGSGPMQDGQNMTNGTVKTVVTSVKGREMDVGYSPKCATTPDDPKCKAGVRHITLPADMVIHEWDKAEVAAMKPGVGVSVRGGVSGDAAPVIRAVLISSDSTVPMV